MKNLADRHPATATRTGAASGGELRPLTGLRIVAAVWVVAFHFHFTALPGVAEVSASLGPLVAQGALGVDLFFVLSGFVIAYTYLDVLGPRLRIREAGRFVWARAGRMWPGYLLVFNLFGVWLVARAILGSGEDIAFQAVQPTLSWGEWLQQVLLVQLWAEPFLDGASWVGPTWSISAEWLAYLLFPVSALLFFRLRRLPAVVLALGAIALMTPLTVSFVLVGSPYYPFSWLVRILCGFSAGVLALLAVRRIGRTGRARRIASLLAGVAGVGIVAGLLLSTVAGPAAVGAVTVLFPVLVGALALADRGPARLLSCRAMVHGGRISYALYLVHIPMFEVLWLALRHYGGDGPLAPGSTSAHLLAVLVLLATIPVAHLLFRLVEQPARRWMRDLPGAMRPAPEVTPDVEVPVAVPQQPVDSGAARRDPATSLLPRIVVESSPVDTALARLDPPTSRLPVPSRPVLDGPPPVRLGAVEWVLAGRGVARAAGHGDDPDGDRLAGNLMAAARLRSTRPGDGRSPSDPARAEQVREVQDRTPGIPSGRGGVLLDPPAAPAAGSSISAATGGDAVPVQRAERGSRTGVERCGRRGRHSAHTSAATPIVATAAASVRHPRRPTHALPKST